MDPIARDVKDQSNRDHRDDADRHVDIEDPTPRRVLGEPTTREGTEDARKTKDGAEVTHVAATLTRRDHVTDDRLRADHQTTRARALNGTTGDELDHVLREPRQHRAN